MIQGQKDLTRTAEGQHRTQEVCRTLHVMSAHRVCNVYLTPFPYNKKKPRTAYCNSRVVVFFCKHEQIWRAICYRFTWKDKLAPGLNQC